MTRSKTVLLSVLALAIVGIGGWSSARSAFARTDPPDDREGKLGVKAPRPELASFRAAIPRGSYQTIVISPRTSPRGIDVIPFVIRSKDAMNGISDFTFFVPVGTTQTINFPGGWLTPTDAELFALEGAEFAAWGVTGGGAGGGAMVRFLPVGRDISRDIADREREREFESFLREQQRNK